MLEAEILRSMIEYPEFIDEFLARSSRKPFSKKGNALLDKILPLAKGDNISLSALKASLPEAPSVRTSSLQDLLDSSTATLKYNAELYNAIKQVPCLDFKE